jgi:hypothetical protein
MPNRFLFGVTIYSRTFADMPRTQYTNDIRDYGHMVYRFRQSPSVVQKVPENHDICVSLDAS